MNILILNGSLRPKGNTNNICAMVKNILSERGHSFTEVNDYVKDCCNCGYCIKSGKCCIEDSMLLDFNSIDAIIILSPMYFFGLSGKAKLMLDRLYSNHNKDTILTSITISGSKDFKDSGVDLLWNTIYSIGNYCGYHIVDPLNYISYDETIEFNKEDLDMLKELIVDMEVKYREIKKEN